MQKQNEKLSQKLKDRIFYVALVVGVIAIFSVVTIYTMGQDEQRMAKQDQDVKKLSEFAYEEEDKVPTEFSVSKEQKESEVASVNVGNDDMVKANTSDMTKDASNVQGAKKASEDVLGVQGTKNASKDAASVKDAKNTSRVQDAKNASKADSGAQDAKNASETASGELDAKDASEDGEALKKAKNTTPVVAEKEALLFNSEETIAWPVMGTVLVPFSMETTVYFKTLDQYRCNSGMLIAAGTGTTVKNAYAGQVTKVTSDNHYGNMVTVSLGNDYSAVYGQLDTVYVKEGDFIKEGASIGTIGKPTDMFSEEGNHLYFEMRQGETPVDPALFME